LTHYSWTILPSLRRTSSARRRETAAVVVAVDEVVREEAEAEDVVEDVDGAEDSKHMCFPRWSYKELRKGIYERCNFASIPFRLHKKWLKGTRMDMFGSK
jgi:hypothetical protein